MVIITPYKLNAEYINRKLRKSEYKALKTMQPAATIDSFQGREGDIATVVMGTTLMSGPGFTTDPQRLNVSILVKGSGASSYYTNKCRSEQQKADKGVFW